MKRVQEVACECMRVSQGEGACHCTTLHANAAAQKNLLSDFCMLALDSGGE